MKPLSYAAFTAFYDGMSEPLGRVLVKPLFKNIF
jgi:hypothetical protein